MIAHSALLTRNFFMGRIKGIERTERDVLELRRLKTLKARVSRSIIKNGKPELGNFS